MSPPLNNKLNQLFGKCPQSLSQNPPSSSPLSHSSSSSLSPADDKRLKSTVSIVPSTKPIPPDSSSKRKVDPRNDPVTATQSDVDLHLPAFAELSLAPSTSAAPAAEAQMAQWTDPFQGWICPKKVPPPKSPPPKASSSSSKANHNQQKQRKGRSPSPKKRRKGRSPSPKHHKRRHQQSPSPQRHGDGRRRTSKTRVVHYNPDGSRWKPQQPEEPPPPKRPYIPALMSILVDKPKTWLCPPSSSFSLPIQPLLPPPPPPPPLPSTSSHVPAPSRAQEYLTKATMATIRLQASLHLAGLLKGKIQDQVTLIMAALAKVEEHLPQAGPAPGSFDGGIPSIVDRVSIHVPIQDRLSVEKAPIQDRLSVVEEMREDKSQKKKEGK